jgi:hypothetical protein
LIDSLGRLTFERVPPPQITLVVVDNDADGANALPANIAMPFPTVYRVERNRGLAAVRNACLDHAPADADVIAFLDDDEWVEPQWLDALLAMHQASGADIVQGPVRPVFAATVPAWLAGTHYHSVGPFVDGAELSHGATGNVLIMRAALVRSGARFHASFDRSGGEDLDFFHQMRAAGCRIVAAAAAVACEMVPADRMTIGWVLRRQFRTGHSLGAIARRHGGVPIRLMKGARYIGLGAVNAMAGAFGSPRRAVRGAGEIARGLGMLSAFAGYVPDHYSGRGS